MDAGTAGAMAYTVQGIGSIGTAFAQSAAYDMKGKFQEQTAQLNAQFAEIQAKDAIDRGETAVKRHKQEVKQLIGSQRAAMAAQGLDLESGSALDVQLNSAQMGKIDELTIKNNAWREAWGYKTQALGYKGQGDFESLIARQESNTSLLTGGVGAAAGFLKAGAEYYGSRKPKA